MASFVDLLASDVWSEADIVNRTEAMIASEFPPAAAAILNRKVTGQTLGQYTLTADEQVELARYAAVSEAARAAGEAARDDMALLQSALEVEAAQRRLALPVFDGPATVSMEIDGMVVEEPNPAVQQDADERTAAQAVISGATSTTMDLVALRSPASPSSDLEVA